MKSNLRMQFKRSFELRMKMKNRTAADKGTTTKNAAVPLDCYYVKAVDSLNEYINR